MKFLITFAFLVGTQARASLPEYMDSVWQIEAGLHSDLSNVVDGAVVSIKALENLQYEIRTQKCKARLTLEAHFPGEPGPTSYSVKRIDQVKCI